MRLITSSLRAQLFAGFAAVQIVVAIGVVVAIAHVSTISSTLENGTTRVKMTDRLGTDTFAMQGSQMMDTVDDGTWAADHLGAVEQFTSDLAALKPHLATTADRQAYATVQRAFAAWRALDVREATLTGLRKNVAASALATNALDDATDTLANSADPLASVLSKEDPRTADASKSSAILISILLGVASLLLGIVIVMLQSRRIVGGVRQMLKAAKALAQGEVDQHVDVHGRDEIAAMGDAFGEVIDYLRGTADAAAEMGAGNFAVEISPRSERDALRTAFVEMRDRVGSVVRAISGTSEALNNSSVQMASSTE